MTEPEIKNPLLIAFGLCLKSLREEKGLSTKDLAKLLKMSGSGYRMVEGGSSPFQIGRSLMLIKVFPEISYSALSRISVATKVVSTLLSNNSSLRDSLNEISQADEKIGLLLTKINQNTIDSLKADTQDVKSHLLKDNFIKHLIQFLKSGNESDFQVETEKILESKLIRQIKKSPSIYLDLALMSLNFLEDMPVVIDSSDLTRWQLRNLKNFKSLFFVSKKYEYIINESNLSKFWYPFLFYNSFEEVRMLFTGEEEADFVLKKLKIILFKIWEEKGILSKYTAEEVELAFSKFKIKKVDNFHLENSLDDNSKFLDFDLSWLYVKMNYNQIGFHVDLVDQKKSVFDNGKPMLHEETHTFIKNFRELW